MSVPERVIVENGNRNRIWRRHKKNVRAAHKAFTGKHLANIYSSEKRWKMYLEALNVHPSEWPINFMWGFKKNIN